MYILSLTLICVTLYQKSLARFRQKNAYKTPFLYHKCMLRAIYLYQGFSSQEVRSYVYRYTVFGNSIDILVILPFVFHIFTST